MLISNPIFKPQIKIIKQLYFPFIIHYKNKYFLYMEYIKNMDDDTVRNLLPALLNISHQTSPHFLYQAQREIIKNHTAQSIRKRKITGTILLKTDTLVK